MDSLLSPNVHFYDTSRHLILCGVPGFADRSTKHERSVTCPACVELLAQRRSSTRAPESAEAGAAVDGGLA